MKTCLLFFFAFSLSLHVLAQVTKGDDKYARIEFNEKGQLIAAPPDVITNKTTFRVVVKISEELRQKRILAFYNRYISTINQLGELNDAKTMEKVLVALGLDKSTHAKAALQMTQKKLAVELQRFLAKPENLKVLAKQVDLVDATNKINKYADIDFGTFGRPIYDLINIPVFDDLLYPSFYFEVELVNNNGLPLNTPCRKVRKLPRITCQDCGLTYTDTIRFNNFKEGPVKYNYQLRMSEDIYDRITEDARPFLPDLRKMSAYDLKTFETDVADLIAFKPLLQDATLGVTQADIDHFLAYIKLPQGQSPEVLRQYREWLPTRKLMLLYKNIALLKKTTDIFAGDRAFAFLMQYAWLTNGQVISANPAYSAALTDVQKDLAQCNADLQVAQIDSTDLAKQLVVLENISKGTLTSCCQAGGSAAFLNTYQGVEAAIKAKNVEITALRKSIKAAKDKLTANNLLGKLNPPSVLSDSLLYDGLVFANSQVGNSVNNNGHWLRPNLENYAYMKHHDKLNDYHVMGRAPILQINERQQMHLLAENTDEKDKFATKPVITYIASATELDAFSGELGTKALPELLSPAEKDSVVNGPEAPAKYNLSAVKLFYVEVMTTASVMNSIIKNVYGNGVLKLPLKTTRDQHADYLTAEIPHNVPSHGTAQVAYPINDLTGKNLNSEGALFPYSFDKLYRFRIKAGMAYSSFKGRTYAVNPANNTATYSNSWTGLAPALGVQVFPVPLDVQSKRILPHGMIPFGYAGYLFNGAPGSNLLVGGGWEIYSGIAVLGGVHFGKSQRLTLTEGIIQSQDYYKTGAFVSLSIGLEAFNIIFGSAKPSVNPFKAP
ncbi:hypothetical protein BDD43_0500 [Mucilaginibacter gracilis]|uniref:Uncharacterized protein n=1 Tax=Mucilaginibacter gracilis TaxID=423350 RepID=A0A495IUG9_9SPHI|nr:hypothetical protein [Mucilaginibacter gracilis]RKR80395.1 hypothetical protein BDD43_0500 [Mucilaginibacter gracilis]